MADSEEVVLKFIISGESKNELLLKAAEAAEKMDFNVQRLTASDVEDIALINNNSVLVFDKFSGWNFEKLKAKNCRIIGPPCLLYCLQEKRPLPNVKHPVYSMAMDGMNVCCTSVPKSERNKLSELIEWMNGSFARNLTDVVTHVVAGEVGSEKYRVALKYEKPVMLPEWVYQSWAECQNCLLHATDDEFNKYRTPCFKGCTICVTGIEADKRKEIKRLASLHGGIYSGELNMNTCTHLLVDVAKGEKYNFARKWNIHCINSQWFYDCIKVGHWLDEANYRTLQDNEQSMSGHRLSITNISTVNSTTLSNASMKSNDKKRLSRTAAQAAYKSAQMHGDTSLISDNTKQTRTSCSKSVSKSESDFCSEIGDVEFDVSVESGNLFLDGCKIYLSGFSGVKLEKLRKLINSGGGTRFNQINESISHVVMGTRVESDVELLSHSSFQPQVVNVNWLLDSARSGKRLAEEGYHCLSSVDSEASAMKKDGKLSCEKERSSESISSKVSIQQDDENDYNDLDDDVFKQYLEAGGSQLAFQQEASLGNQKNESNAHTMLKMDEENQQKAEDEDVTVDEIIEQKLLAGKVFKFVGFALEQVRQLNELISEFGGCEGTDEDLVDFVVTPMNYEATSSNANNVVTFCWLEQSLEVQKLLDPCSSLLFKPMRFPEGSKPLNGCVLSISQFLGPERDHLLQLAELLGAHCQEHFVRKSRSNLLASTHLLLQEPQGSKYDAAIKWNIPVVNQEWLFACARSGKMENVEHYSVGLTRENDETKEREINDENSDQKKCKSAQKLNIETGLTGEGQTTKEVINSNGNNMPSAAEEENLAPSDPQLQMTSTASKPVFRRSFLPSFDLTDALEEVASPLVPSLRNRKSRGSRQSFPLDDLFAANVQQRLRNAVRPEKEKQDGVGLHDIEQESHKEEGHGILHGVILAVSKKLKTEQAELYTIASSLGADYRWIFDESCTHLIHQGRANDNTKEFSQARERGIHIVSPHWLYACASESKSVDETHYPHTYNPKMSLATVVTSGPKPVTRSNKQSTSLEQTDPHGKSQLESRTLSSHKQPKGVVVQECPPANGSASIATGQTEASQVTSEHQTGDGKEALVNIQSLEAQEELEKQLNELSKSKSVRGRRRSRRVTSTNSVSHNASGIRGIAEGELGTRRTSARIRSRLPPQKNADFSNDARGSRNKSRMMEESEQSQSDHITYDDPDGRMEREKIMAHLKKGRANSSPDDEGEQDGQTERGEDNRTAAAEDASKTQDSVIITGTTNHSVALGATLKSEPPSPGMTPTPVAPPPMVNVTNSVKPEPVNLLNQPDPTSQCRSRLRTTPQFQLSAMTQEEKIDYCALIEQLGGVVHDTMYFNTACTHVVVGKPNRNEKYLAACAAGKWLLHKSYLEASREAGFFVLEDPHEWGLEQPGEPLTKLASAARRWRLKLQDRLERSAEDGAFSGWKVILCVDKSRQPGFKRLLEAGGAKVVRVRPPFDESDGVTHAFIDSSRGKHTSLDLPALHSADIWLLKPEYIAEYLMQDPAPNPRKYLIPEALELLEGTEGRTELNYSQQKKRKAEESIGETKRSRMR